MSPPPIKRRRLVLDEDDDDHHPTKRSKGKDTMATISRSLLEGVPKTIRVYSWNINGIQPFIPASAAPITSYFRPISRTERDALASPPSNDAPNSLRAFLSRHNWPEVLFLQELKISPASGARIASALLSSLNTPLGPNDEVTAERSYTVDMVLPRDKYNAKGFQGRLYGVATILRTDFSRKYVSCVREVDWDLEGRINIVETRVDEPSPAERTSVTRPLAFVNVYAVNGTSAPYYSPETGKVTGTRHDHKLAFHSRLRGECLSLEARGFDVVVAGDLNIARGVLDGHPNLRTWPVQHCRNRADFNAKFFGRDDNERARAHVGSVESGPEEAKGEGEERCFDGVDVFRALHGSERRYTYHLRTKQWGASCDRVDFIITSRRLWEEGRVWQTGILDSPQERGPSDHVPLWAEIAMVDKGRDSASKFLLGTETMNRRSHTDLPKGNDVSGTEVGH